MHTSYEESIRANYERMDDAELLNIARERDDLTCTAQRLLAVELEKRGITNSQIQVSTNESPAKPSMSTSYEESVRANYERMDDAELLNIASGRGDLTSTAQRLLAVELEKRRITDSQTAVSVNKSQADSSMGTFFNALDTSEGRVQVITKTRWMGLVPMPHTSVMPHGAADLARMGTMIKWTTNDSATLATLHDAIVHLVEQVGISGLVEIRNNVKMTEQVAKTLGGNWHDIVEQVTSDGVDFPVPEDVLRYMKGFM